jgi:hypothetical protein
MPWAVRALTEVFSSASLGEVYLLNDPYRGGSHLPDLTVLVPVLEKSGLRFWSVVRAHHSAGRDRADTQTPLSRLPACWRTVQPATASWADGEYEGEAFLYDEGFGAENIRVHARLRCCWQQ